MSATEMYPTDYETRDMLLAASLDVIRGDLHRQISHTPSPNDDADADYTDDMLLLAARNFVERHKDYEIPGVPR